MKKNLTLGCRLTFLILVFLLQQQSSIAQWNTNTSVNLQVTTLSVSVMMTVSTTDGKIWASYYHLNGSNYQMWAQLLDQNGNKLLGPDGVLVDDQPTGSATYVYNSCVDENNNLIIACQDQRSGSNQAVIYKVSQTGAPLWGVNGVVLGAGLSPYPGLLSNGEVVVAWAETVSNTLNMQKISSDGTILWAAPIAILVGTTKTNRGQVLGNLNGKFSVVYQKKGTGISSTMYAQHFDNNGTALYLPVQLSTLTASQSRYYSVAADGDTTYCGYYLASGSRFNSYVQRINPNGTLPYGINGSNFNTSIASTDYYQSVTNINLTPSSPYVWSVCSFMNSAQNQYGVYIQKFRRTTGARMFSDLGKVVFAVSTNKDQQTGNLNLVNDSPMFMMYDLNYIMYATRLDTSGNFAWPYNRTEISSTTATTGTPKGRFNFGQVGPNWGAGAWYEDRGTGTYYGYIQGISSGGLIGVEVTTQGSVPAVITTNGGTLQVQAAVFPAAADQNVTWSMIAGTGTATVSNSGLVTATGNGTVWARATAVQDPNVSDTLLITISGQSQVPGSITVTGTVGSGQSPCYNALSLITVAGNGTSFHIENGGSATLISGSTITILPTTQIDLGAYLHAYITTNDEYCSPILAPLTGNHSPEAADALKSSTPNMDSRIRLYPNPASGYINLDLSGLKATEHPVVSFQDLNGNQLFTTKLDGGRMHLIEVGSMQPGMYIVTVRVGDQVSRTKLVLL